MSAGVAFDRPLAEAVVSPLPTGTTSRRNARMAGLRARLASVARGLAGFGILALLYEGFSRLELINPKLLPPSSVVLPRAWDIAFESEFQVEVWATLEAVLIGVALACALAVPAGLLIGSYTRVATAATPIVDFVRSVPGIAIIPLLVLIMGQGLSMKVAVVVYVTMWPLLFNTIYGVRGVDRVAVETARSFRVGAMQTWWQVVLPSSLPLILTGVRLALATGLTVAIAAEIAVGTRDGVGYYILLQNYSGLNYDAVYAAVVLAGLLGFALNWLTTVLTDRYVAWDSRGALS